MTRTIHKGGIMNVREITDYGKTLLPVLLAMLLAAQSGSAAAQGCNRDCLAGLMTQYVDAVVAQDATSLPLADTVKVTVDGRDSDLETGIWQSVTGFQGFRQDYLDVRQQVAAAHLVFHEGENHILLSVLLHVDGNNRINGVESLVQRLTPTSRFQPRELGAPIRGMDDPVPAGEKCRAPIWSALR